MAGPPSAPPVFIGRFVVLPLTSGLVVARAIEDGREEWTASLMATGPLAAGANLVIVPLGDEVQGLDPATGRRVWSAEPGTLTAPLLARGGWIIAVAGDQVTALRERDGGVVWTRKVAPIEQRPALDGELVLLSVTDGRVMALDLRDGSLVWESDLGGIPGEPFVFADRVYVQIGERYWWFSLNRSNGRVDSQFRVGAAIAGHPAADADRIYVAAMDNLLRGYDSADGALQWRQPLLYRPIGGPLLVGASVVVPGRTSSLPVFDTATLKPRTQLTLPDPAFTVPVVRPPGGDAGALLAVVTNALGKPWLLHLLGEPPPSIPEPRPLTVLPGSALTISLPTIR